MRIADVAELVPGSVVWAYARGYWRQVRVVAVGRRKATVLYRLSLSGGSRRQEVPAERFRLSRPIGAYGVVDVPAPGVSGLGVEGGDL